MRVPPMPFPIPPQSDSYIWQLAEYQDFVDDLERTLNVICLIDIPNNRIMLIDDLYLLTVASKTITTNPKSDLSELAHLWFALIQLARGKYAPINT